MVLGARAVWWAALESSPLSRWYLWRTDENANLVWAAQLVRGSWWDDPPFRSYFQWQRKFGSPEEWERWYPRKAFFQMPLYAYGLAALWAATGDAPIFPARLLQILLGAATAGILAAAVRRLALRRWGEGLALAAGAAAGLLYGLYAPSVFHDAFLLRDGPFAHLSTLLLVAPLASGGRPRGTFAFLLGLLGGTAVMLRQTALPLAVASLALVVSRGEERRRGLALAGALGLLLPILPLVVRNVRVGASPLAFDTRQAIGFAWGNARGADATTAPPESLGRIVEASRGSSLRAIGLTLAEYRGAPLELPALQAKKLATFLHRYEVPDNNSFDFFRERFAALRPLPVFPCLFGVGLAGLFAARSLLSRGEKALLLVAALTPLAAVLMVQCTSRYRLPLAAPLAIGAGLGIALAIDAARRRAAGPLAAGLAGAALLTGVTLLPPVIPTPAHRYADALTAATLLESAGDLEGAEAEIRHYMQEGTDDPGREVGLLAAGIWLEGERGLVTMSPSAIAPADRRVRAGSAR